MVQRKTSLSCVNGSFFPCPFLGLGRFLMAIGISEKQSFSCVKRIPTLGTSINVDVWICARFITYYYMNFALFFIIDALAPSQEEEFFEGGKNQFLIIWLLHGVADSCRDKYSGRSIVIGARNLRVCCLIKKIFEFFRGLWVSRIISMIFHWVLTIMCSVWNSCKKSHFTTLWAKRASKYLNFSRQKSTVEFASIITSIFDDFSNIVEL